MPTARLRLSEFRAPWWRRPAMLGVAGAAVALACVAGAAWLRVAPLRALPEPAAPGLASTGAMRSFDRVAPDARTLAAIAQNNPMSSTRSDFVREAPAVAAAPTEDTSARDRQKRLDDARRDLQTLRLVATMRVRDEWIALFEPAVRKAEDDLLSLRVGDEWRGWTVSAIARSEVRVAFDGQTERLELKPDSKRSQAKTPAPRGRVQVETRPVAARRVTVDPPISRSEARERLLGATRDESDTVRELAEELLEELEREGE